MRELGTFLMSVGCAWLIAVVVDSDRARFATLVFLIVYGFATIRDNLTDDQA